MATGETEATEWYNSFPQRASINPDLQALLLETCIQPQTPGFGPDGSQRSFYFDLDHFDTSTSSPISTGHTDALTDTLASAISLAPEGAPVQNIAFLRRRAGPVGAIVMRASLTDRLLIPSYIVDPHKRTLAGKIRPFPVQRDISPILVVDNIASGKEAIDAIEPLHRAGLKRMRVLSLFDTDEGARENLASYFIPLTVIISAEDMVTAA